MDRPVRHSKKRSAVYEALRKSKEHPAAEWIYETVRRDYPDISRGTVYRNLALFKAEGQAVCVAVVDGQERYDAVTTPHSHFICRGCGAVLDAGDDPALPAQTELPCGRVESRQVLYRGLCCACVEAG